MVYADITKKNQKKQQIHFKPAVFLSSLLYFFSTFLPLTM